MESPNNPIDEYAPVTQGTHKTPSNSNGLVPSPKNSWRLYTLMVSIGLLALVFIVGGFFVYKADKSLPGEPLYSVKTQLIEKAIWRTKLSASTRASYDVQLLETRLRELQTLGSDEGTTTPEVLAEMMTLIGGHAESAKTTLKNAPSLQNEERIDTSARLAAVTRAEEVLVENTPEFASLVSGIEEMRRGVTESLDGEVETFASSSSPELVNAYLSRLIGEIAREIKTVAPGSNAERLVIKRLSDVNDAVMEGKTADALAYILKAKEAIAVDGYLFDAERGIGDGVVAPSTEIPEGS